MEQQPKIELPITESTFNIIWFALHDREQRLLRIIEHYGEDSDEAAMVGNDVVSLRFFQKGLRAMAENLFASNVFMLDDTPIN